MLLQTLVENAIKHGVANRRVASDVTIMAALDGGKLRLEVENTGHIADGPADDRKLGLKNARERLEILYGSGADLKLAQSGPDRVRATVVIPAVSYESSSDR